MHMRWQLEFVFALQDFRKKLMMKSQVVECIVDQVYTLRKASLSAETLE